MRDTITEEMGINVGGRKISNIRYADDTALCATDHHEAQYMLEKLNTTGKEKHLKLNAKKTKCMHIGPNTHHPIMIDGEKLEEVTHFKYLGSVKTTNADCSKDINIRIGMAKRRMIDLNNIWKDKSITNVLKIKIMKCLVWTIMTYGAEGWTIKDKDKKKILAAEMWFYRRMMRISWKEKRTNEDILKELNIKRELLQSITKKKLIFLGHVCRNKKCTLMKDVIQGKMEGKRGRGRPRESYMGNIRKWTGMNNREIFNTLEDRQKWRSVANASARAASDIIVDAG